MEYSDANSSPRVILPGAMSIQPCSGELRTFTPVNIKLMSLESASFKKAMLATIYVCMRRYVADRIKCSTRSCRVLRAPMGSWEQGLAGPVLRQHPAGPTE
ncbi:hypothetical protein FRC08_014073 [Ceratobasidium sp. 394]|nr:hypothetical protein FRC08_014073 [Ceratobasidium sp. 394]